MQYDFESGEYSAEQRAYAARVYNILSDKRSEKCKALVVTFGCQQNVSDSQRIRGMLSLMGYDFTEKAEEADFIIFNTCAVREHAEDRVFGNVGAVKKYKKQRKGMIIAVCGCMAQQDRIIEKFKTSYPYVDIVFGTGVSDRLPEFVYKKLTGSKRIFENELNNEPVKEGVPINRDDKIKGFVPVMYGCDNFCTYCIVPYVRGRERSRKPEEIIKEVTDMVNSGYKEVMLLGQNVNSYGKGLKEDINFAKLLRMVNDIPGDFRIRFMTSHPKDCTKELLLAMSECEKVERHLHLPVQSGSDRILKMMNRKYTAKDYLSLIKTARELMPDISFTSDIIVGFPGETFEDYLLTEELVKEVEYSSLFTFIYSKRNGTPAATMPDPVSRAEKGKWFSRLLAVQDEIGLRLEKNKIGKTLRVLIESENDGELVGKAADMSDVTTYGDPSLVGTFCDVKITAYDRGLTGEIIKK
ncbi:MAG: tRNA (N6-isopentenyl adenosine(37)-C2)-methylthiotransferase MiaB [Clostridia bacterium]|nr:tRNA (N6-isopentenyl adenosine(37)-C2)-methylthiotransferase MiaB [Clostridia bacterium]